MLVNIAASATMVMLPSLRRRVVSVVIKNKLTMSELLHPDAQQLKALAAARMPYGKHTGSLLVDLPEPYVVWLVGNRLPDGLLGRQLREIYEIKVNGLESLLRPLQQPGEG